MGRNSDSFGRRVQDLIRGQQHIESSVSMTIRCTLGSSPFATVRDMERTLLRLRVFEGFDAFDDIGLGPLTAHPLIKSNFKLPPVQTRGAQGPA